MGAAINPSRSHITLRLGIYQPGIRTHYAIPGNQRKPRSTLFSFHCWCYQHADRLLHVRMETDCPASFFHSCSVITFRYSSDLSTHLADYQHVASGFIPRLNESRHKGAHYDFQPDLSRIN